MLASCCAGVELFPQLVWDDYGIAYPRSHCRRIPRASSLRLVLLLKPLLCCEVVSHKVVGILFRKAMADGKLQVLMSLHFASVA
jgi:hypothetical protein